MPTWHNPNASTVEPYNGLADNCGGYTYAGTDRMWPGIVVQWGLLPSGEPGFRWYKGGAGTCQVQYSIACRQ